MRRPLPAAPVPPTSAALAILVALAALAPEAHADARLASATGDELTEAAAQLRIEVRGLLAEVTAEHTWLNAGTEDAEAIYQFELPADAVVTSVEVTPPGRGAERGFAVNATAAITLAPDHDTVAVAPDLGLLRVIGEPRAADTDDAGVATRRYELRVFPVPHGKATVVRVHWVAPLQVSDGRVVLQVPARGDAANLSRITGSVRYHLLPGIRAVRHVYADGAELAAVAGAAPLAFTARTGPLTVEATLDARGGEALAWLSTVAVDRGRGVAALQVFVPRAAEAPHLAADRLVLVVDTSSSLGAAGLQAEARLADGVLGAADPATKVRVVLFDRAARPALAEWRPNDRAGRAALVGAIEGATIGNGSDLAEALTAAGDTIADVDRAERVQVVVITDGVLPLDTDPSDLVLRLRQRQGPLQLSAIALAPAGAPLPDTVHTALADATGRLGGRTLALRAEEIASRLATLGAELQQPAPIADLTDSEPTSAALFALPEALAPGEGALAVGWYDGAAAPKVTLTARRADRDLRLTPTAAAEPAILALALAASTPDDLIAPADRETAGEEAHDLAARALADARRAAGVVDLGSSLVVLDRGARLARERAAMAKAGGPYARMPPPAEAAGNAPPLEPPSTLTVPTLARAGGELTPDVILQHLRSDVLSRSSACFTPLLQRGGTIEGTVELELELTRGELTTARVIKAPSTFDSGIKVCLLDAAYALRVPETAFGSSTSVDPVYVVHYPVTFRSLDKHIAISGDADSADPIDTGIDVDAAEPLSGLPVP